MFIWWILMDVAAVVLGMVLASRMKESSVGSTIGNSVGQLLSGIWTLQMTSEVVLGMDRDWREVMLDEAGGLGYFVFRFLGWGCIVMGIGMLLYALIQTLEKQKAQPKAQWPTGVPGQAKQNAAPSVPQQPAVQQPVVQQPASAPAEPAETETIFCPKCGRKQRKSNAACWACGASLHD